MDELSGLGFKRGRSGLRANFQKGSSASHSLLDTLLGLSITARLSCNLRLGEETSEIGIRIPMAGSRDVGSSSITDSILLADFNVDRNVVRGVSRLDGVTTKEETRLGCLTTTSLEDAVLELRSDREVDRARLFSFFSFFVSEASPSKARSLLEEDNVDVFFFFFFSFSSIDVLDLDFFFFVLVPSFVDLDAMDPDVLPRRDRSAPPSGSHTPSGDMMARSLSLFAKNIIIFLSRKKAYCISSSSNG